MKSLYSTGLATAMIALAAADASAAAGSADTKKSIVPTKYAGKYKGGGSDALAEFIKGQATGKEGFEFQAFFSLCRANIGGTLTEEKIKHYEDLVASKAHGAEGRARMTLRNMLATIARKNGELVGLDGNKHAVEVAKPTVSGAAAKAQETAAATETTEDSASASDEPVSETVAADETTE